MRADRDDTAHATTGSPELLFRPEVLAARQAQWLGSIRIARPLSFSVVTVAALAMAAALIAFACWGEVTRKVTLHGVLLPAGGLINVAAPQYQPQPDCTAGFAGGPSPGFDSGGAGE